ncbi:hypothetical protein [Sphingomonas bacterium]|uniref:hypothetical protein n=1 Tax=Sphingomonas bacterium TaxID=1895847 RepID=UPI001C2CC7A6|nr:hypothetical protein [Sphingomonas bacterium]
MLIAAGVAGLLWCNKRAFDRRNAAGVQEFRSYGHSLGVRTLERLARLGGLILILGGFGRFVMVLATGH